MATISFENQGFNVFFSFFLIGPGVYWTKIVQIMLCYMGNWVDTQ